MCCFCSEAIVVFSGMRIIYLWVFLYFTYWIIILVPLKFQIFFGVSPIRQRWMLYIQQVSSLDFTEIFLCKGLNINTSTPVIPVLIDPIILLNLEEHHENSILWKTVIRTILKIRETYKSAMGILRSIFSKGRKGTFRIGNGIYCLLRVWRTILLRGQ